MLITQKKKKWLARLHRNRVGRLQIHQRGFIVFHTEEDNCPVPASQGLGPLANGVVLQLEVTGRKVLTPINLVSGELSIRVEQKGRTHHLAVIGVMGETRSVLMRSTLTCMLISDQTSAADTGAGGRRWGGVE